MMGNREKQIKAERELIMNEDADQVMVGFMNYF